MDYNIYLHASTSVDEARQKTTPSVNRVDDTNIDGTTNEGQSVLDSFTKVKNDISSFATSGFTGMLQQGIAQLGQVFPWVAVAYAIFKTSEAITDMTFSNISEYTGHYEYSLWYNNMKAGINNFLQPVSFAKRQLETQINIQKKNYEIEQNRTLVGSATLRNLRIGI